VTAAEEDIPGEGAPEEEALPLLAYKLEADPRLRLVPAAVRREWMDGTDARYANRCLPLLMANQSGWLLLSRHTFTVQWNGERDRSAVQIRPTGPETDPPVVSHFGHGIITFHLPYVFRTPPGWNLLVRGPANRPKDGIAPLEGLVETDWAPSTFTMNWQLTRPGLEVEFCADEPVGMIVPQRRAELERFRPTMAGLDQMPDMRQYHRWKQSRMNFIVDLDRPGSAAEAAGWQRDYMIGVGQDGSRFPEHQRHLRLRDWEMLPENPWRCG